MAIRTLRSALIRDACQCKGVSLAQIKANCSVLPNFFYKVVLGDKRSAKVDQVIIGLLDDEEGSFKKRLQECDRLMNMVNGKSVKSKVVNGEKPLTTAKRPKPDTVVKDIDLKNEMYPDENLTHIVNPILRRIRSQKKELIVLKIRAEIKDALETVISQLKRPLTDDKCLPIVGSTLNTTIFVEKSMNRYNRLCIDGINPLLNLDTDGPFLAEVPIRIETRQIDILKLKAEKENSHWRTMLRAIIEWNLLDAIEKNDIQLTVESEKLTM